MIAIEKVAGSDSIRRVILSLTAASGKAVSVAGSFNDWDPEATRMTDSLESGRYQCTLMLAPGSYEYKFVIDGDWMLDDTNPNFAANDFGTLNSVLSFS